MILIGLGANLERETGEKPAETLRETLGLLPEKGLRVEACSPFYASRPVPPSHQPWFVNAVAAIECDFGPEEVLSALLEVENRFGRVRKDKNEARVIDLDLLDFKGKIRPDRETWEKNGGAGLILPHPRLHERLFVLQPLADIAPGWVHPVLGLPVRDLIDAIGEVQKLRALEA